MSTFANNTKTDLAILGGLLVVMALLVLALRPAPALGKQELLQLARDPEASSTTRTAALLRLEMRGLSESERVQLREALAERDPDFAAFAIQAFRRLAR